MIVYKSAYPILSRKPTHHQARSLYIFIPRTHLSLCLTIILSSTLSTVKMKLISIASFTALFAAFVAAVPVPEAAPVADVTSGGYKRGEDEILGYKRSTDEILGYKREAEAKAAPVVDVVTREPAAAAAGEKKKRHCADPLKKNKA
jgi:hypothetical protein